MFYQSSFYNAVVSKLSIYQPCCELCSVSFVLICELFFKKCSFKCQSDSLPAVKMSKVIKEQIPGNDSKVVVSSTPYLYPSPQISYTLLSFRSQLNATASAQPLPISDTKGTESTSSSFYFLIGV